MVSKKKVKKKAEKVSKKKESLLKDFNFFKPKTKFQVVFKNFLTFLVLGIVCAIGYFLFPTTAVISGLLWTIFVTFGCISCALLICLLVLLALKKYKN